MEEYVIIPTTRRSYGLEEIENLKTYWAPYK